MQPLLANSHNPLGQLSTNHLRWILTPSEFLNHIITTLWTHVSKGWTHGTRAICVAWFPTKSTEAPSSLTNLSLETWKLTSTKWSVANSPPSRGIHLQMGLNPAQVMFGEWKSPLRWKIYPRIGLNPVQLITCKRSKWNSPPSWKLHLRSTACESKLTQLANAFSYGFESRLQQFQFQDLNVLFHMDQVLFKKKTILLSSFANFSKWLSFTFFAIVVVLVYFFDRLFLIESSNVGIYHFSYFMAL